MDSDDEYLKQLVEANEVSFLLIMTGALLVGLVLLIFILKEEQCYELPASDDDVTASVPDSSRSIMGVQGPYERSF